MNRIYLDYASTTPVDSRVLREMMPYFVDLFENPSALYSGAFKVQSVIKNARAEISSFLNCSPREIVFTSGGTESDNLAIAGILNQHKSGHVITTEIEHPAVLNVIKHYEKKGFEVTYIKPNRSGIISELDIKKAIKKNTILISVMYANNEIGTIQPIKKIAKILKKNEKGYPLLHTDACQATGYLDMNVASLGVDLLTINGSKVYAPKGIGVLYVKEGTIIKPLVYGGSQERGLRAGTENVAAIVGLSKALSIVSKKDAEHEKKLRDYLIEELLKIKDVKLNGSRNRLPNNINISVKGIEGESIVLYLDRKGIEIATGSACSSKSLEPSRVIKAIADEETAHSSLRITLGRFTKKTDLDIFLKELKEAVNKLREISAL